MKTRTAVKKNRFRGLASLLFVLLVSASQAGFVDVFPVGKIADSSVLSAPGKLAIDSQLALYVADGYRNRLQKFESSGNHIGSLKVERPSAVAAGRDSAVYVGSHRDYSVGIYKNGKRTGQLGDGAGEFSSILDMAVDDITGDVYVADARKNAVKIYTASGVPRGSFSGFNAPLAVWVSADDVYVLDSPATGSYEGPGTGSRISVFSKSGTYRWSIDERAGKDGHMIRPVDIAVDRIGNIFVADPGCNAVLVYDKQGTFIGRITGQPDVLRAPVGLGLSRDGRLYVSSSETHSILEIGLEGVVDSAAKISLDFKSKTGAGLAPAALGY